MLENGSLSIAIQIFASCGILGLVAFNVKQHNGHRNEMNKEISRRLENVVYDDTCKAKYEGVNKRIDDLQSHMDTRFDDLIIVVKGSKEK